MKTKNLVSAYSVLSNAKYQKLSDEDKVKVWKIYRSLKPIADKYTEDTQDAQKRLMPDEDFLKRLSLAQQYEAAKKEGIKETEMKDSEYLDFLGELNRYNTMVKEAVDAFNSEEQEVAFDKLDDECFGRLISSNDWTLKEVEILEGVIVG